MARTPLFKALISAIKKAQWLEKNPHRANELEDSLGAKKSTPLSRREFIAQSALTLAATSSVPFILKSALARTPQNVENPVIILGAGLAGLTAAYTLRKRGIACEIIEASDRVGGRVMTLRNFTPDNQFCELGAELVDSNHDDIIGLAQELGLDIQDLRVGDKNLEQALFFFNGKRYYERDLIHKLKGAPAPFSALAENLNRDQKMLKIPETDFSYTAQAANPFAKSLDKKSLKTYLNELKNVDSWVKKLIEVAFVGEMGLDADEQSALNLLLSISPDTNMGFRPFGDSDEAFRIGRKISDDKIDSIGNQLLPERLLEVLTTLKTPIHLGRELIRIDEHAKGIRLYTQIHGKGSTSELIASRVICTVPFSVLRSIEGIKSLPLHFKTAHAIREMGYGTNSKHMFAFTSKHWRDENPAFKASNGAVYSDLSSQTFWETSRMQNAPHQKMGILTNYLGGTAGRIIAKNKVQKTVNELESIFPGIKQTLYTPAGHTGKDMTLTALMHWSKHRLTRASYSCPRPGQYFKFWGAQSHPQLGGKLHFAGEHTSTKAMGFMSGAVESGKRAAMNVILQSKTK